MEHSCILQVDCLPILVLCFLCMFLVFPTPVYLSSGVSALALSKNFMCVEVAIRLCKALRDVNVVYCWSQ